METPTITKSLKHIFNDAELLQIGKDLADKANELASLEDDKKRVTSDFKAKIDTVTAEIGIMSRNISTGNEYRMIKCSQAFHVPHPGKKTITRLDTFEVVQISDMTTEEMQQHLPI